MSANMYWQPTKPNQGKSLPCQLKSVLARRYFNQDGSLSASPQTLGHEAIPFLEGIAAVSDGEVLDAVNALIEAIENYESIDIWIER